MPEAAARDQAGRVRGNGGAGAAVDRASVEALLLVAEQPLSPETLASLLDCTPGEVQAACEALAEEYEWERRGFALVRVAGGYRYQTAPHQYSVVKRFALRGQQRRLSAAALETLAIVAYKQPVSRYQVGAIRGVDSDAALRTLRRRGYVDEVARAPGPGQAVLFGTTSAFLERLGLDSLEELPPLGEFVPEASVVESFERRLRIVPDPDPADSADTSRSDSAVPSCESEGALNRRHAP